VTTEGVDAAPASALDSLERPTPLADVAFEHLRRELLPGGFLFETSRLVEADLADRLDMSRTPVREALHRLALIGILEPVPGGGYIPRRFTLREIRDHYELRILLEPMAAALAASAAPDIRVASLASTELKTDEVSADANTRFHKAIGRMSGNPSLSRIVVAAVDRLSREGVHARGSIDDQHQLASGHASIVDAIGRGDAHAAASSMREHLRLALTILIERSSGSSVRSASPRTSAAADGLDAQPRERLSEGAYQELRNAILGGRLLAGTMLSETSVADALHVSRTPTRFALRRLESEGYIDRDERGRMLVHRLTRQELSDLFAIRRAVEAEAARRAAGHVSDAELARLDDLLAADLAAVQQGNATELTRLNDEIHAAVLSASRSHALVQVAADARARVYGFGFSAFAVGGPDDKRRFVEEHAAVARAIRDGDGNRAAEIIDGHLARALSLLDADFSRYDDESRP
jgi:DNA-binding GntR family transcriptional regulator